MSVEDLVRQAEELADALTGTVNAAVTDKVRLSVLQVDVDDDPVLLIGNELPDTPPAEASVGTFRGERIPVDGVDELAISANWQFIPNSSGRFLKTLRSEFGLWVKTAKSWAPFIRLEVDPSKGGHDQWLAAHINVTGESRLLGYINAVNGKPPRRLQGLHLPVGGFRYRPCLEDFLEFAIDEGLIPERPGAREALDQTRHEYRLGQLKALVAKYPDVARDGLEEAGLA